MVTGVLLQCTPAVRAGPGLIALALLLHIETTPRLPYPTSYVYCSNRQTVWEIVELTPGNRVSASLAEYTT